MTKETGKFLEYSLSLRGVYGRNRTEKFTTAKLKRIREGEPALPEAEVKTLVDAALAQLKVKRGKWTVQVYPVEVGDVFESILLHTLGEAPILRGEVQ